MQMTKRKIELRISVKAVSSDKLNPEHLSIRLPSEFDWANDVFIRCDDGETVVMSLRDMEGGYRVTPNCGAGPFPWAKFKAVRVNAEFARLQITSSPVTVWAEYDPDTDVIVFTMPEMLLIPDTYQKVDPTALVSEKEDEPKKDFCEQILGTKDVKESPDNLSESTVNSIVASLAIINKYLDMGSIEVFDEDGKLHANMVTRVRL